MPGLEGFLADTLARVSSLKLHLQDPKCDMPEFYVHCYDSLSS